MGIEALKFEDSTHRNKNTVSVVYLRVKRVLDFVCSLLAMIILSPIFLILVIAIKIDSKGPVLFKQKRFGIHKTYFKEHKNITACKPFTEKEIKVA